MSRTPRPSASRSSGPSLRSLLRDFSVGRAWLFGWVCAALACSSPMGDDKARPEERSRSPAVADLEDARALGAVTFPFSDGTPDARAHFTRGLLALHSFWYDEATRQFQAAIDADPTMNMAYWGAAMSRCQLLWGDDDVAAAREA